MVRCGLWRLAYALSWRVIFNCWMASVCKSIHFSHNLFTNLILDPDPWPSLPSLWGQQRFQNPSSLSLFSSPRLPLEPDSRLGAAKAYSSSPMSAFQKSCLYASSLHSPATKEFNKIGKMGGKNKREYPWKSTFDNNDKSVNIFPYILLTFMSTTSCFFSVT